MTEDRMRKSPTASHSQDLFQMMFDGADLFSAMWQPMLKSVGRWHLEVAGLGLKQGQASLQWSRDVARSWTPGDVASANIRYWNIMTAQYAQSSERLAQTAVRAVEAPLVSEVVSLPTKPRGRDVLEIPGRDVRNGEVAAETETERKVA